MLTPNRMFTMCGFGTSVLQQRLVQTPFNEQHWQKEEKGGSGKAAELDHTFQQSLCPRR